LLRKVRDLVEAGATVIGPRPVKSPSLSDYPECDADVQRLAAKLWDSTGPAGKGRIIAVDLVAPSEPGILSLPASARWIWHPEGNPAAGAPVGTRRFHREFAIEANADVESARLMMTADNAFELQVNGELVGRGDNFKQIHAFDLKPRLKTGNNVLSVLAENGGQTPNPAGLIGALVVRFRNGRELIVPTDRLWQSAESDAADRRAAMELGEPGMSPWGAIDMTPGSRKFPDLYCDYERVAAVLDGMSVPPDFESDANLRYTHRRDGDTDIYFVANPADQQVVAHCAFRVTGKRPAIWNPMTGEVRSAGPSVVKDKRTRMQLSLEPCGSVFVVFSKTALGKRIAPREPSRDRSLEIEIAGPWEVRFEPKRGAPEKIVLNELVDWSKHSDPGVKYFSGRATYRTLFTPDPAKIRKSRWSLDLGRVEVMAQVKLNGKDLGVLWKAPFQVEITEAVKAGENVLEVTVVNLWPNRLIGDQSLPPQERITWTTWSPYTKDSPLLESGLLGPVRCRTVGR
jgi:hypothetical protein